MPTKKATARSKSPRSTSRKDTKTPVVDEDGTEVVDAGNVDKIRDILFGNQMREYDSRFRRMEEALHRDLDELRDEVQAQGELLRNHLKSEIGDLRSALGRETDERMAAVTQVSEETGKGLESADRKLAQISDAVDKKATELRHQILEQSESLTKDIAKRSRRLSEDLSSATRELGEAKLDRSIFASFLVELAHRVSDGEGGEAASSDPT